jgi:hypothetical protein
VLVAIAGVRESSVLIPTTMQRMDDALSFPVTSLAVVPRGAADLDALLAHIETIAAALQHRDHQRVRAALDGAVASHLPRAIREELLLVAGQSTGGFRVAIEFLRYRHRMRQLRERDAPLSRPQLEMALGFPPPVALR